MIAHRCRFVTLLGLWLLATTGCKSGMVGGRGDHSMNESHLAGSRMQHSLDPLSTNAFEQARELERKGETIAALRSYVQIAEAHPDQPAVWQRMAVAYDKVGHRQYATSCYERAIELDPLNADLWCDCGYGQFLAGDFESAERSFRRALDFNPSLERAHNNLGLAMAKLGDTSSAVEHFKMAGCDVNQAAENLKLARGAAIMAQPAPLPVAMQASTRIPASMPPIELPSISSQPVAEMPTMATQSIAELPTMVTQSAAELPTITTHPATELQTMAALPAAALPTMAGHPAEELPMVLQPLELPVVMETSSEPPANAADVASQNYYATDPSLTKSITLSPIVPSPLISAAVEDTPKTFSIR
jgi:Tfp pilus assembly protein PilF